MSEETTPMSKDASPPRTLGSALAALGKRDKRRGSLYLEEPVEDGIGVSRDAEDDVLSVQQSLGESPHRAQPKRASLIERSKQFQDKLVKFMADYSTYDVQDVDMEGSQIGESNANNFPTRARDICHVDQRVNLMNASSKRHDSNDGYDVDEEDQDYYYGDEEEEEDDVYAGYTEGYSSKSGPSKQAFPPKKDHPDAGTGEKICEESEDSAPVKKPARCATWRYTIRWSILAMLFVISFVFLVRGVHFFSPLNQSDSVAIVPAAASSSLVRPRTPQPGQSTEGEIYQRKHDLETILEEELFPEAHEDADLMDLRHEYAKKSVTWMTKFDTKSMILLDDYHNFLATNRVETSQMEYEDGKERESLTENFDDPKHHFKTQIVDRYVEGLYYFKAHPEKTPQTAFLA